MSMRRGWGEGTALHSLFMRVGGHAPPLLGGETCLRTLKERRNMFAEEHEARMR